MLFPPSTNFSPRHGLSILLAEGAADDARSLAKILKGLGHKVCAVADGGAQAVRLAGKLRPGLVIMGIGLSEMDGVSAARLILERTSVPVIISIGRNDIKALEATRYLNIQAFLIKPFSAVQLRSAIAIALSQHKLFSQARRKISQLSEALETVQGQADADALTVESLGSIGLTRREAEVMHWIAQGKANGDIAMILESSPRTVAKHVEHIFLKLKVESRTAAVGEARRLLQAGQAGKSCG